ncbi:MAG TPA: class II aldolase/adducin family protein [Syntrophomonas sp.]|nr:class II aldolase/adducin family protein [Syntrophomonas sp.]
MNFEKIRADVIAGAIKCQDMGLIHGTSGNVSIADREFGIVVITPSGIPYQDLSPEDVPVISLEDGRVIEGEKKPSKETPMHLAIYHARPKMNAVVHTHSLFATVMSIFLNELPAVAAASAPYAPIKVAPFEIPGSAEIAEAAVKAMEPGNIVCLLQSHGQIAAGVTLDQAISIADYVEENAQTAYYAHAIGHMTPLPEEGFHIMRDRARKSMGLV